MAHTSHQAPQGSSKLPPSSLRIVAPNAGLNSHMEEKSRELESKRELAVSHKHTSTVQFLQYNSFTAICSTVFHQMHLLTSKSGVPNNADYQETLVRIKTIRSQCIGRNSPLRVLFSIITWTTDQVIFGLYAYQST